MVYTVNEGMVWEGYSVLIATTSLNKALKVFDDACGRLEGWLEESYKVRGVGVTVEHFERDMASVTSVSGEYGEFVELLVWKE